LSSTERFENYKARDLECDLSKIKTQSLQWCSLPPLRKLGPCSQPHREAPPPCRSRQHAAAGRDRVTAPTPAGDLGLASVPPRANYSAALPFWISRGDRTKQGKEGGREREVTAGPRSQPRRAPPPWRPHPDASIGRSRRWPHWPWSHRAQRLLNNSSALVY
jgi:hypothetical protein